MMPPENTPGPIIAQQIGYSFHSKPLGTKFAILETSASSYQSKKASLSQECVRRLLNTDVVRSQEERNRDTIVQPSLHEVNGHYVAASRGHGPRDGTKDTGPRDGTGPRSICIKHQLENYHSGAP